MPVTLNLAVTLSDEDAAKLAALVNGGAQPALNPKSDPPHVSDGKKGKKGAAPPAEPAAEEPAAQTAGDSEEAPTTDLVTEKQLEIAKETADAADLDDVRAQLTDYYVGQGSSKKDVQNAISSMSEDDLRAAYNDYLARLVVDETGDFTGDFETPYIAVRIDDGKEVKHWILGGVTLTPEEVAEKKLADPEAKAAPKKGPALPSRKK